MSRCDIKIDYVWLLIGWFSNPRDETEIVAGVATVVAYGGSLSQSINIDY